MWMMRGAVRVCGRHVSGRRGVQRVRRCAGDRVENVRGHGGGVRHGYPGEAARWQVVHATDRYGYATARDRPRRLSVTQRHVSAGTDRQVVRPGTHRYGERR